MSDPSTTGLDCRYIVGIHTEGAWKGFEKPCGNKRGTTKDPRSKRYDDGLCPTHMALVTSKLESTELALKVFRPEVVTDWFRSPNPELGGRSPDQLCEAGQGERVYGLLLALAEGVTA